MATTLTKTPLISGDDIIKIVQGTDTNDFPTVFTDAIELQLFVNTMPQFFPDVERNTYRVRGSIAERSMSGGRGSMDGAISVYYVSALYDAHVKMLEWQLEATGCFWLLWYIRSEDRTVAVRVTADMKLKTPEGESGGLTPLDLAVFNIDESIEKQGNAFE